MMKLLDEKTPITLTMALLIIGGGATWVTNVDNKLTSAFARSDNQEQHLLVVGRSIAEAREELAAIRATQEAILSRLDRLNSFIEQKLR